MRVPVPRRTFEAVMEAVKDLPKTQLKTFPWTIVHAGDTVIPLDPVTAGELTQCLMDSGRLQLTPRGTVSLDGVVLSVITF
jgi:hypothetical protein